MLEAPTARWQNCDPNKKYTYMIEDTSIAPEAPA